MLSSITYTPIIEENLPQIQKIYNYYIENSKNIFYTVPLTLDQVRNLIPIGHPKYSSFLIQQTDNPQTITTVGFVFVHAFSDRQAYDATAEVAIYLNPSFLRKGIGTQALLVIEKESSAHKIKHLISNIAQGNTASIQLFKRNGYKKIAQYPKIATKFGQDLDLFTYQKDL